jgi:hypothetical protein
MKHLIVGIIVICSMCFGSMVFAEENQQNKLNPTGTIVGQELLNNRFEYVDPSKPQEERPPVVQELLDKGVFTSAQDAKTGGRVINGGGTRIVK